MKAGTVNALYVVDATCSHDRRASRSTRLFRDQSRLLIQSKKEIMAFDELEDNGKLKDWLTRCEAIAESDSFVRSGHPEDQVIILRATLLRAAAAGVNWREIYRSIYEQWHTRHPHFPDLNAMASEIEYHRSRSEGT